MAVDPFVVLTAGKVDVFLPAGESLTVAYENGDQSGYTSAFRFEAPSQNQNSVPLTLWHDGGIIDAVTLHYGDSLIINGITYAYEDQIGRAYSIYFDKDISVYGGADHWQRGDRNPVQCRVQGE